VTPGNEGLIAATLADLELDVSLPVTAELATLARVGLGSKVPILERTPELKRTALLTSVVLHLEASAIDDALDLFSVLMQVKLISAARRATDRDWVAARGGWRRRRGCSMGCSGCGASSWTWSPRAAPTWMRARCGGRWRRRSGRARRSWPPLRCWES
jgi:hypothetical protein